MALPPPPPPPRIDYFEHIREKVSDHIPISFTDELFTLRVYAQIQILNRTHLNLI